ncbi:hypothetical protein AHAS_Ahas13G0235400 [Arachis hypogaea]
MEPRVRKYVVRDHPFQHSLASPLFDHDPSYVFSLSWLHPNSVHHPFDHMHGGPVPAQQDGQAVPESGPIIDDYIPESLLVGDSSDGSPHSTSEIIVISDDEDIEEIEIVDLASEDDEDPEMDMEIVDLTFDSD